MTDKHSVFLIPPGTLDFSYAKAVATQRNSSVLLGVADKDGNPLRNVPTIPVTIAEVPSLTHAVMLVSQNNEMALALERHHEIKIPRDVTMVEVMAFSGSTWHKMQHVWHKNEEERTNYDIWAKMRKHIVPDEEREQYGWAVPLVAVIVNKTQASSEQSELR